MPSTDEKFSLERPLARNFADHAAGELRKLHHVVAQIFRLLFRPLDELLEQLQDTDARTMTSA
jgi:hypothetical protein